MKCCDCGADWPWSRPCPGPKNEGHYFTRDSLAEVLQSDTSTLNIMLRRNGRPNAVFWEQEAERLIRAAKEADRER
jgi:hypothetical protein